MKNDLYLKIILTIIAICLVWICIGNINIGPRELQAANTQSFRVQDVRIVDVDPFAFISPIGAALKPLIIIFQPFDVKVTNWPDSETPEAADK